MASGCARNLLRRFFSCMQHLKISCSDCILFKLFFKLVSCNVLFTLALAYRHELFQARKISCTNVILISCSLLYTDQATSCRLACWNIAARQAGRPDGLGKGPWGSVSLFHILHDFLFLHLVSTPSVAACLQMGSLPVSSLTKVTVWLTR